MARQSKQALSFDVVDHLAAGRPDLALVRIQDSLTRRPDDTTSLELLVDTFDALTRPKKSLVVLEEIASLHDRAGRRVQRDAAWARVLRRCPGHSKAKLALTPTREPAPTAGPIPRDRLLAELDLYLEAGLQDRARRHLRRLLEADPDDHAAQRRQRRLQRDHGQGCRQAPQASMPSSAKGQVLEDDAAFFLQHGLVEEARLLRGENEPGQWPQAAQARATTCPPGPVDPLPRVREHRRTGQLDQAIALLHEALGQGCPRGPCHRLLGLCYQDKGQPREAIKWFKRGLRVKGQGSPDVADLHFDLARAYQACDDPRTAEHHDRQGLELNADHPRLRTTAGKPHRP